MQLDVEEFLPELRDLDISMEHKIEIITIIWEFMESQLDKAYGVHATQLALQAKCKDAYSSAANDDHPDVSTDEKHNEAA